MIQIRNIFQAAPSGIKKDHMQYCGLIAGIFIGMDSIGPKSYAFALFDHKSLAVSMNFDFAREDSDKFSGSL